jgi:hypothetical protein
VISPELLMPANSMAELCHYRIIRDPAPPRFAAAGCHLVDRLEGAAIQYAK